MHSFYHYAEPITLALLTPCFTNWKTGIICSPSGSHSHNCFHLHWTGYATEGPFWVCVCLWVSGCKNNDGKAFFVLRDDLFELFSKHDPKSQQVITEIEICHLADIFIQRKRSHRSNSGLNALLKGRMVLQQDCDLSKIPSLNNYRIRHQTVQLQDHNFSRQPLSRRSRPRRCRANEW